jgi:uncharacterized protein YeaO (DUF488 family)
MLSVIIETIDLTMKQSKERNLPLFYGAKDKRFDNAVALKEYVETKRKEVK